MGKTILQTWKDCREARKVESFAVEHGCIVRKGKGSHRVMEAPNGSKMPFYNSNNISTGVANIIFKWFRENGWIPVLIGIAIVGGYVTYLFS